MRFIICTAVLICVGLISCKKSNDCTSNAKGRQDFFLNTQNLVAPIQYRTIALTKGKFTSFNSSVVSSAVADKALQIASQILSSHEFQDNVSRLDFQYANHCLSCSESQSGGERIPGMIILDSTFRKAAAILDLNMNEGRCKNALGSTCPNYSIITSNYKAIECDMSNLPFEYAYAVHICHEYMHIIGYCHTDHKDDVAEQIGWIAYYIALDWTKKSPM